MPLGAWQLVHPEPANPVNAGLSRTVCHIDKVRRVQSTHVLRDFMGSAGGGSSTGSTGRSVGRQESKWAV